MYGDVGNAREVDLRAEVHTRCGCFKGIVVPFQRSRQFLRVRS